MSANTQPVDDIQRGRTSAASGMLSTREQTLVQRTLRRLLLIAKWLIISLIAVVTASLVIVSLVWGPTHRAVALLLAAGWIGLILLLARRTGRFQVRHTASVGTTGLLLLSAITVALSQMSAYTPPIVDGQGKPVPGSIATLERVSLHGVDQWISIRAVSPDKPVLLWLAGGPGGSQISTVRWHLGALEDHFVVVNWEQPGSGKSYGVVNHADLTVERYVADGIALVEYLRQRFDEDKVYLVGESWGSALGVWMVQRDSDLFHAFVSSAQMVDFVETDVFDYNFALDLARERGDTAKVAQLEAQGPPPYSGDGVMWKQTRYLLDGFAYMNSDPNISDDGFNTFRDLLSPEYGLYDKLNWARGALHAGNAIFPQLWVADVDFRRDAPVLGAPVYFLVGRHDINAPPALAEEYYRILDAPHKELIWFERSGHNPWVTESDRFAQVLIDRVLQDSQN